MIAKLERTLRVQVQLIKWPTYKLADSWGAVYEVAGSWGAVYEVADSWGALY